MMMSHDHDDHVAAPPSAVPADGIVIEFPDSNRPDAGNLAKSLKLALDNATAEMGLRSAATVTKVEPNAQDLGTILAVVLGQKATLAVATGIALWMRRHNQARIRVGYADGRKFDISGVDSRDVAKIIKALNTRA